MSFAARRYGLPKNFGNLDLMSDDDLQRFARIVKARREELGLRQDQLRDADGPSTTRHTSPTARVSRTCKTEYEQLPPSTP